MPRFFHCTKFWLGLWGLLAVGAAVGLTSSWVQNNNWYSTTPAEEWILVGGVTSRSARFRLYQREWPSSSSSSSPDAASSTQQQQQRLVVSTDPNLSTKEYRVYESESLLDAHPQLVEQYGIRQFHVHGLQPDTTYHYGLVTVAASVSSGSTSSNSDESDNPQQQQNQEIEEGTVVRLPGHFRTPAPEGTPWNFTVALAGCAQTGSKRAIFDVIRRQEQPDLFLHLGDFHYEDLACNCLQERLNAVHTVLNSRPQAELYRSTILVNMWDDHDWLDNNSGFEEKEPGARETALRSYQILFPHYDLATLSDLDGDADNSTSAAAATMMTEAVPPYHAFTMGTVRFIVSDLRSESTEVTIYSAAQRDWLRNELGQAGDYDFVVWVTTKPYIGAAEAGSDSWLGHEQDRRELSEFILQAIGGDNGPQNLLAVSADAHMLGFDDGTNTNYGPGETVAPSFPILQSGPLDRIGSAKGGPYTEGCHAVRWEQNHQYSTIRFEIPTTAQGAAADDACMHIDAYRVNDRDSSRELVFSKRLCGKIFAPSRADVREGTCEIQTLPAAGSALFGLSAGMTAVAFLVAGYYFGWCCPKTALVSSLVWLSWLITMLVGLGTPFASGTDYLQVLPVASIVLGQAVVMDVWIAYWGRAEAKQQLADDNETGQGEIPKEEEGNGDDEGASGENPGFAVVE